MKIDPSKKRLTACCSRANGVIDKKHQKFLILKHNYEFIIDLGKEKYKMFYFHKTSDVLPFTKGIVKLL